MAEGQVYSVYKVYDAADQLLYIGVTGRPVQKRLYGHLGKPWYKQKARVETEQFTDRVQAYRREYKLISRLEPIYNTQQEETNRKHRAADDRKRSEGIHLGRPPGWSPKTALFTYSGKPRQPVYNIPNARYHEQQKALRAANQEVGDGA